MGMEEKPTVTDQMFGNFESDITFEWEAESNEYLSER